MIKYQNFIHKEYRSLKIPLKDLIQGALQSTAEMLQEVSRIIPDPQNDEDHTIVKEDMEIIQNWYHDRYEITL